MGADKSWGKAKHVYLTPLKRLTFPILRRDIWVFILFLYPSLTYLTYRTWDTWHPTAYQVLSEIELYSPSHLQDSTVCPKYNWMFDLKVPAGVPLMYPNEALPVELLEPLLKSNNFALLLFAGWGALVTLSVLSGLLPFWTAKYRKFVLYSECQSLDEATHILVETPSKKSIFCPVFEQLAFVSVDDRSGVTKCRSIEYMKKIYNVLTEQQYVKRIGGAVPVEKYITKGHGPRLVLRSPQADSQMTIGQLHRIHVQGGLFDTKKHLENSVSVYGYNEQDIPIPSFLELFGEHAVSPLFVFQVFCVVLWMVDELWQYSLMTLGTLVMFEGQMVFRRRKDLMMIRGMHVAPIPVALYRFNQWWKASSVDLVPGDVYSLAMASDLSTLPSFPSKHPLPRKRFNAEDGSVACPCDSVLLSGGVVANEALLTGESLPQMKSALDFASLDHTCKLTTATKHKRSALFAGTCVIMETKAGDTKHPEIEGAICLCLKTGFRTTQGKLIRTVLYSSERATAASMEAIKFLLILLCVAVFSSGYVLYSSWGLPNRNHFKLLIHCIMIITSVVPPDLPITMSMTVTLALAGLTKKKLYCTEPFRIPFAGQLTTCCFDKTGTLTASDVILEGVTGIASHIDPITASPVVLDKADLFGVGKDERHVPNVAELPAATLAVMGCCHSLISVVKRNQLPMAMRIGTGGKLMKPEVQTLGDPLEKAMLAVTQWKPSSTNVNIIEGETETQKSLVLRRFHFSSEEQRMTVVARVALRNETRVMVLCKGAPDKVQTLLRHVPAWYQDEVKKLSLQGRRILALAAKNFNGDVSKLGEMSREELENNLSFCGILVLGCPIKDKTLQTLRVLRRAGHALVMITGDDPRTAAYIALETELVRPASRVYFLNRCEDTTLEFVDREGIAPPMILEITESGLDVDLRHTALCLTGRDLPKILERYHKDVISKTAIFARVTPGDKEYILRLLGAQGHTTLMCGDGTNDVGALKAANVGISLLNFNIDKIKENKKKQLQDIEAGNIDVVETVEESRKRRRALGLTVKQIQYLENIEARQRSQNIPFDSLRVMTQKMMKKQLANLEEKYAQDNLAAAAGHANQGGGLMKQLQDQMSQMDDDTPLLKPGDASMASPFTYRGQNIKCVKLLVRSGKATLATVMMTYKLMALNSLTTAFALSVLTINGVKFGDLQSTVEGIFISVLFIATSNAKSTKDITPDRVVDSMFNPYFYWSIILQALTHISTCLLAWALAAPHVGRIDKDGPFKPNLVNTVIFLVSAAQHAATFTANYEGAPFLTPIRKTKVLGRGVVIFIIALYTITAELFPLLNRGLKLVAFPNEQFRYYMLTIITVDILVATAIGMWFTQQGRLRQARKVSQALGVTC
eukprot:Blabericola_migrator_1__7104@NODE_35_length_17941_cov_94_946347_g31_i0_p1_GENE_NODE_35_length_17941_cov_94_946347_g31_i0NODE_35_length_17941_cov_94_946347_g31_i0_p1_ORF_typecomplete_len1374_score220_71Hydrolase/PF00702_26/5_3e36E1E2_ATPase/PF00122_20/1_5e30Cation_ATPase/PF13246_6/2_6e07Cation_ATPase/PF13246_6/7_8e03Hydrolase_3/PF08282_12/0_00035P5ATPase/PF12409_8/0_14_NODE_35_length_17941_cov_94_946347_g31_i017255846